MAEIFSDHEGCVCGLLCWMYGKQCDRIKIAKCLKQLPKYDYTRKMNDFDSFTKLPNNVGDFR